MYYILTIEPQNQWPGSLMCCEMGFFPIAVYKYVGRLHGIRMPYKRQ